MTAIWQNFERHWAAQPTTLRPEVQARISGLEGEVASLKALLQVQDEEIASRDMVISKERANIQKQKEELEVANNQHNEANNALAKELDHRNHLEA